MKPLSRSRTAIRRGEPVEDALRASGAPPCSSRVLSIIETKVYGSNALLCPPDDNGHRMFTGVLAKGAVGGRGLGVSQSTPVLRSTRFRSPARGRGGRSDGR